MEISETLELNAHNHMPNKWKIGHVIADGDDQYEIVDYVDRRAVLRLLPDDERVKPELVFGQIKNYTYEGDDHG